MSAGSTSRLQPRVVTDKLDGIVLGAAPAKSAGSDTGSLRQTLALLYQEFLTAVVRVQAGERNVDQLTFRQAAVRALRDAEKKAASLHYDLTDVKKASLAVVALLDEVALASSAFQREQWAQLPLALELFQEPRAGQIVFEDLDELLRTPGESRRKTDLLELYLTVLILGFEGKHAGMRAEIRTFIDRIRERTASTRPRTSRLAPELELIDAGPAHHVTSTPTNTMLKIAIVFAATACVLFLSAKLLLWWMSASVAADLAKRGF